MAYRKYSDKKSIIRGQKSFNQISIPLQKYL